MSLRENLWKDDLSQIDLREAILVAPDLPVAEVVSRMQKARNGCAVVWESGAVRGIFTERDYVKRVLRPGADMAAPVREVMTADPVTVRRSDTIGSLIRTMHDGHYRHVPVVDDEGRPIGVASVKVVVQYLVDYFPESVYNLPPEPRQVQEAREGA